LNDLFTLARTSETTGSRLLALRGGIGLLEKSNDLGESDRLKIIEQEMQHAEGPEARRLFVSLLGKQTSLQALQYTLSCMDQPGITDEAALAVTAIAKSTGKEHPAETRTALEKALRPSLSPSVAQEVRSSLKALEPTMDRKTIKAAIVTGGHEFDEQAFIALFKDLRGISVTFLHQKDDSEIFQDVSAWPYDVVVLYNMTRKISEKRQRNFTQLLDEGVGLLSMHHASAAFQDWREFRKIIGVRYRLAAEEENGQRKEASIYQHDVTIPVRIADASHPVTRGVSDFVILDETYKGCAFEPDNHLLLTTTEPTSDPALGWTRTYGRARIVHLQLGHGLSSYSDPQFRRIVEQALRWCAEGKPQKVSGKGANNE
jgi:type 1 glutamine amidotransferase